jgi:hypothetical protein
MVATRRARLRRARDRHGLMVATRRARLRRARDRHGLAEFLPNDHVLAQWAAVGRTTTAVRRVTHARQNRVRAFRPGR